ncbi:MAG: hypothetical protein ACI9U2_002070 [Bradymonadia bacterium]|jgi:hypothetical protein
MPDGLEGQRLDFAGLEGCGEACVVVAHLRLPVCAFPRAAQREAAQMRIEALGLRQEVVAFHRAHMAAKVVAAGRARGA